MLSVKSISFRSVVYKHFKLIFKFLFLINTSVYLLTCTVVFPFSLADSKMVAQPGEGVGWANDMLFYCFEQPSVRFGTFPQNNIKSGK